MEDKNRESLESYRACGAFFKEMVDKAIQNQHIQISDEAVFYLIVVMSGAVKSEDKPDDKTLAERFNLALQDSSKTRRIKEFKTLGDSSLIIAGIWWQSLLRKIIGIDYYVEIGKRSYQKAGEASPNNLSELFEELADNFNNLVNVSIEATRCISEAKMTDSDILHLYITWLETHNTFLEQKLRSFGINPVDIGLTRQ